MKMLTYFSNIKVLLTGLTFGILFTGCTKTDDIVLSKGLVIGGTPVKPGNISGSIKGTLLSDSVYYVTGDVTVNRGDTLILQPGAKVYIKGNYAFWVKGNLASIGTKAKPVYFTIQGVAKLDAPGQDPTTDPAYMGKWIGIQGDTSTQFMIFKYTHIEFAGGLVSTGQVYGVANGKYTAPVYFTSQTGMLVFEDSWMYGEVDGDASINIKSGKFHIMRNIFEKCGYTGGEAIQTLNGSQGNIAYNLIIGPCTNAIKVDNGNGLLPQVNTVCYNNTILNGGFRRFVYGGTGNSNGRGASIGFERAGRGLAYNNLFVDDRYGLRITKTFSYFGKATVIADTANIGYGNSYYYGDATEIASQFYPENCLAKPLLSDIPLPSSYLPTSYQPGDAYDGSSVVDRNNPRFVNYPLPIQYGASSVAAVLGTMSFKGNFDFHLQPSSPCLGKGTTSFAVSTAVTKMDPVYGATEITPPGTDLGCYQSNNTGLQN